MGRLTKNAAVVKNQVDSVGLPWGTGATTPTHPVAGQVRFNTDSYHIEVYDGLNWDTIDGATRFKVTQNAHGFSVFQAVYFDGTQWQKAIATSEITSGVGVVSRVINANVFEVQQTGVLKGLSGLTSGAHYFLSDSTPGLLATYEPPLFSNPMFYATSTTEGLVLPYRPRTSSGANGLAVEFTSMPLIQWDFFHNRNTTHVTYQAFDTLGTQIYPDSFTIVDNNNVSVEFGSPQMGTLYLMFF